jgi:hypothetical protein
MEGVAPHPECYLLAISAAGVRDISVFTNLLIMERLGEFTLAEFSEERLRLGIKDKAPSSATGTRYAKKHYIRCVRLQYGPPATSPGRKVYEVGKVGKQFLRGLRAMAEGL